MGKLIKSILFILVAASTLIGCRPGSSGSSASKNSTTQVSGASAPNVQTNSNTNSNTTTTSGEVSSTSIVSSYLPFLAKNLIPQNLMPTYTTLTASPQSPIPLETIELQRYQIQVDRRIASMLRNLMQNGERNSTPDYTNCEFDVALDKLNISTQSRVVYALDRAKNLCSKLHRPELFFYTGSLFQEGPFSLLTMESLIEAVVTPTIMRGYPFSYFDPEMNQIIRAAFLRVKFPTLTQDFNDLYARIDAALTDSSVSAAEKLALSEMRAQAASKWNKLLQWNENGKLLFSADTNRVIAAGKRRNALGYTNLPDAERKALTMYIYAMSWRIRGGGFVNTSGTLAARLYFAQIPFTLLSALNGAEVTTAAALGVNMYGSLAQLGWGVWMDMGNTPGEDSEISDLVNMTARGLFQTVENEKLLAGQGFNSQIMRLYSLHFGICYMAAWDSLPNLKIEANLPDPYKPFFDGPTAWGEHCAGAAFGLGISETLLAGKK